MALFKILKGNEANLPSTKHEGWAYVTEKGNMYVDLSNDKRVKIGNRADTAEYADKATGDTQTIRSRYLARIKQVTSDGTQFTFRGETGDGTNAPDLISIPLAGDKAGLVSNAAQTIKGEKTFANGIKFPDVSSTTYPAVSAGLTWTGSTDGAKIYYEVQASDKGMLIIEARDDTDAGAIFRNSSSKKEVSIINGLVTGTFKGNLSGTASHATSDANGKNIASYVASVLAQSDNRTIRVTKGDGTTNDVKLYFAASSSFGGAANSANILNGYNEKNVTTNSGDGKIRYSYNVNNGTTGLFAATDNANGILTISRHGGNYYSQLGFSSNGKLYYRSFSNVALNTTTTWKQIAFTDTLVDKATQAEKDWLGQVIDETYMKYPLSISGEVITMTRGDGVSSTITVPDTKVTQSETTTANYRPIILGYTNTTDATKLSASTRNQVYASTKFYAQPSTGLLVATTFKGALDGNAKTATNAEFAEKAKGDSTSIRSTYIASIKQVTSNGTTFTFRGYAGDGTEKNNLISIPAASATIAGLVTNAAQTFAGIKTFKNNIDVKGKVTIDLNGNKVEIGSDNKSYFHFLVRGQAVTPLTFWFGGPIQSAGSITPYGHNTHDIGSAGNRWKTGYFGSGGINVGGTIVDKDANELRAKLFVSTIYANTSTGTSFIIGGKNSAGDEITTLTIPNASKDKCGLITNAAQGIWGEKTFNGKMTIISTGTSTTTKSSTLRLSSSEAAGGGAVGMEFWRGTNASWQIVNDGGKLYFKNNYTSSAQTSYSQNSLVLNYNTGAGTIPYLGVNGENLGYRLNVNGSSYFDGTVEIQDITTHHANIQLDAIARIRRNGHSANWNQSSTFAMITMDTVSGWSPFLAQKTTNGWWTIGHYDTKDYYNHLLFGFLSDVDVNGVTNAENHLDYTVRLLPTIYESATETSTDRAFVTAPYASNKAVVGTATKPVYVNDTGVVTACTYELKATLNSGSANRLPYYSSATAISQTSHFANTTQIGINTTNTTNISSYNLYVEGTTKFNGNVTHNGITYFANGTTYYINNSADAHLNNVSIGGVNFGYKLYVSGGDTSLEDLYCHDTTINGFLKLYGSLNCFMPANFRDTVNIYDDAHFSGGAYFNNSVMFYDGVHANKEFVIGGSLTCNNQIKVAGKAIFNGSLNVNNTSNLRNVKPQSNNIYNLGTSSLKWANVYATTFHGSLDGNAANADTVDGYHASQLWRSDGAVWNPGANVTCTGSSTEWSFDINSTGGNSFWHVWSSNQGRSMLACYPESSHVAIPIHLYVGGYNHTGYALSTSSFICQSWIRTTGATGWYNESYGGGIYMEDSTWVRTYNNKNFYCSATMGSGAHLYTDGYFRCSGASYTYGHVYVGSNNKVHFWEDNEGGNIQIIAPNGKEVQMDMYNSQDFRIYSWNDAGSYVGISMRRSDGHFFASAVHSAVWNDYAEYRESDTNEPGYVVYENGDDTLSKTTERLQHFAGIISDTFGFCEGETEKAKTPLAVAGRVLAYPYQDRDNYKPGDCVCAAPGGTVDIMTRDEITMYPDRIVGTVSCVPNYEEWGTGNVKVNGRIWIKVK